MDTTPKQLKKENILVFLTPRQRLAFSLTNKADLEWIQPILRFLEMPVAEKIVFLQDPRHRAGLTDDLIVEAFSQEMDTHILSLLVSLPDTHNKPLKQKLRDLLETRLSDRNYKKLIKKTLLKNYIHYLLQEGKSVASFLNRIRSPEVRSQAIEQYLLATRNNLTPATQNKWIGRISDPWIRQKTIRMLR